MSSEQFQNRQPPFWSPLSLRGQVLDGTPQTLAIGGLAAPTGISIRNPNKTAMLVDEIHFSFNSDGILAGLFYPSAVAQTRTLIQLGQIPLTKDFVPLVAICPTYVPVISAVTFGPTLLQNLPTQAQPSLVWHFPRPMYVPPNVPVTIQFKQYPLAGVTLAGAALTGPFDTTVVGRSLPSNFPVPESIYVPWATATVCDDPSLTRFSSGPSDLINTTDGAFKVTRFIGNAPYLTYLDSTINWVEPNLPVPLTVRMGLSNGKMLVRDPVPFYNLFSPSRRYFDVDGILQKNEFVRAIVEAPSGLPTESGGYHNVGLGAMSIGMIGYRVLKTPQGSWHGA